MPITEPNIFDSYPRAHIDQDTAELYEGWLVRELRAPRCNGCGRYHLPFRSVCPFCWSFDLTPVALSGRGTVHLAIILNQGPEYPGVEYPYPVVTVELEEQEALRFTSTVIGCSNHDIHIGMPVELAWFEREGAPFPAFRPRKGEGGQ